MDDPLERWPGLLAAAVARGVLTPRQVVLIAQTRMEGRPLSEVAAALGRPYDAVRMERGRAEAALRQFALELRRPGGVVVRRPDVGSSASGRASSGSSTRRAARSATRAGRCSPSSGGDGHVAQPAQMRRRPGRPAARPDGLLGVVVATEGEEVVGQRAGRR